MGIFDDVIFSMPCPNCGSIITGFQTKDGDPYLRKVDFHSLRNFYASCKKCHVWVVFNRKPAQSIDDFDLTVEKNG